VTKAIKLLYSVEAKIFGLNPKNFSDFLPQLLSRSHSCHMGANWQNQIRIKVKKNLCCSVNFFSKYFVLLEQ